MANQLFAGMTAWFSPSCSTEVKKKWEKENGGIVDNVNDAMFLFSDDPDCKKTLSIYQNEPGIVVFQSKWIDQAVLCSINGVLSTHKIETYMLIPTSLKKDVHVTHTKKQYKDFVKNEEKRRKENWETYEKHVNNKVGSSRTNKSKPVSLEKLSEIEDAAKNISTENNKNDNEVSDNNKKINDKKDNNNPKKIIKETKMKRRSNVNLSDESSPDEEIIKKTSKKTNVNTKSRKSKRVRKKLIIESESEPSISEASDSDMEFGLSITPGKNRVHRSAEKYNKKYIEPDSLTSDSSDDIEFTNASNNNNNKEKTRRSLRHQNKDNKTNSKNLNNSVDSNQRLPVTRNSSRLKKTVTKQPDKAVTWQQLNAEESQEKTTLNGNEDEINNEKETNPYPKRLRKPVTRDNVIPESDISNIFDSDDQDEDHTEEKDQQEIHNGRNKKRKLYNPSTNSVNLKQPVVCIEKTPMKPQRKRSDLAKEKLSPNDIHDLLNEGARREVLLSGNVRSSERKNDLASSPVIDELSKQSPTKDNETKQTNSSKSQTMKEHLEMINHKKNGEKSQEDFAYGSFSGFTHVQDLDIPDVNLEDFIVNKNGCRVKLI